MAQQLGGRIFDFGNGAASNNIIAYINNNNLGFVVYNNTTVGDVSGIVSNVNDNVWRHCVWIISKISNNTKFYIYINGSLSVTKDTDIYFPPSVSRANNYIGLSNWITDPGYNGNVDDFRIYKEALTQDKIDIIYNYR